MMASTPQVERAVMTPPQMSQYTVTVSAASYPAKDAREMFFRPHGGRAKPPRKTFRKKKKKFGLSKPPLTDKERAQAAREHWELHHEEWSPEILGHHHQQQQFDHTLPMTPTTIHSMMRYHENMTVIHNNLNSLSP